MFSAAHIRSGQMLGIRIILDLLIQKTTEVASSMLLGDAKIRHIPYLQRIHSLKRIKAVMTINTKLITTRRQYSARGKGVLEAVIWKQTAKSAQPFTCPSGLLMWPPRH